MKFESSPLPDAQSSKAMGRALEALLSAEAAPAPYRSAWRNAGLLENVDAQDGFLPALTAPVRSPVRPPPRASSAGRR